MRERAEELGGTWAIEPVKSGGTRVLAQLPYVRPEPADALVDPRPGAFNQRKPRLSPTRRGKRGIGWIGGPCGTLSGGQVCPQAANPDGVGNNFPANWESVS